MSYRQISLHPSHRGLANIKRNLMLDLSREAEKHVAYDPVKHPEGLLDITSSINSLMANEMTDFVKRIPYKETQTLQYGSVAGSFKLTSALANFVNCHFCPTRPIEPSHIMATNGVTSLLDIVSFAACDSGEGVMYTTPAYGMFNSDLTSRNGIRVVEVPCHDDFDQFLSDSSDDLVERFEDAFIRAQDAGITVRAVLLCNPCNPLGRNYSRNSLVKIARFCGKHKLHLISDEIYAMSTHGPEQQDEFTSVLSIDDEASLDSGNIHVLYGASKDWGLGGLRLGFLITRNHIFKEACRRLGMFTWISAYSDLIFSAVLSDQAFVKRYLKIYKGKLRQNYCLVTDLLDSYCIPYKKANAGIFVWIDLSKWTSLVESRDLSEDSSELKLTKYLMRENLYLEPGEAFFSPTLGKFRLAYAMDRTTLRTGLLRLNSALRKLEKSEYEDDIDKHEVNRRNSRNVSKGSRSTALPNCICS